MAALQCHAYMPPHLVRQANTAPQLAHATATLPHLSRHLVALPWVANALLLNSIAAGGFHPRPQVS